MVNVGRAQGNKQQVLFKGIMSSYLHFDSEEEALHENNPVQNSTLSDFTIVICKLKKEKALQRKTFSLRIFKPYFLLCWKEKSDLCWLTHNGKDSYFRLVFLEIPEDWEGPFQNNELFQQEFSSTKTATKNVQPRRLSF